MIIIFQFLEKTKGKKIPFKYKLLYNMPLTKNDLIYNGDLYLGFSKINYLPDNLTVSGYLDLEASNISVLPNNLFVNRSLFIENTNISELPEDLYVGSDLICINTPLADNIKNDISLLTKYKKQVKGTIIYVY